jgi:hypothetical protein
VRAADEEFEMRLTIAAAAASLLLGAAVPALAAAPPKFALPLACVVGQTCEVQNYVDRDPAAGVLDYHCGQRTYDKHTGVDIRLTTMVAQRRGVAVLAAAPGTVLRIRDGMQDISIRAPGAPSVEGRNCGNAAVIDHGGGWTSTYCHMARGSVLVKPGQAVATGQPLGKVGLSGDTEFPHVHFQVGHDNQVVDPFAPGPVAAGACPTQTSLWTPAAAKALSYRAGAVLNAGFASAPPTQDDVDNGAVVAPTAGSPAVVAYVRAINLELGDSLEMSLTGPDGKVMAQTRSAPLDHGKAVWLSAIGRKRPPTGFASGLYHADYRIIRRGKVALSQRIDARL